MTAGVLLYHAASLVFSGRELDRRHVGKPHGGAVLVGDDQLLVVRRRLELVVGVDREGARGPVEVALRGVHVAVVHGRAQVVDVQPVRRQGQRVGPDAHRLPLAAADAHEADAGQLRDVLGEARVGQVLDRRQREASSR